MKCVVSSIVLPSLCFISRSQVALRACGSMPDVGSSRTTNFDPPMRAMPTLCGNEGRMEGEIEREGVWKQRGKIKKEGKEKSVLSTTKQS